MTEPTQADRGPWECFRDASYYDMWCVRRVHDRAFGQGFHLVQGDEAANLRDHLNRETSTAALSKRVETLEAENARKTLALKAIAQESDDQFARDFAKAALGGNDA